VSADLETTARGWEVFRALALAEIKQERDLTVAGFLRWSLEPLSYMVVYFVLIAAIFARPREAFPLFLLAALIPFRFFTETINRSLTLVPSYQPILTNRTFPREVLPLVVLGSNATTFVLSLGLLIPFMLAYRVPFTAALGWLPAIIAVMLVLTAGPAYIASLLGLYFPDFRGVIQNLIRVSFFVSSGLVTIEEVPGDDLPLLVEANPLSSIFDAFRAVILSGDRPSRLDLLYPLVVGIVLLVVGILAYRWRQPAFAKEV
jgi:ABC-type polysaccharide/polyol phosphate export permease